MSPSLVKEDVEEDTVFKFEFSVRHAAHASQGLRMARITTKVADGSGSTVTTVYLPEVLKTGR